MVQGEPGEDAEEQRSRCVDEQGPERERVVAPHADMVDQQRAQDGTGTAGERHDQGQAESGGGAHVGTTLRPSAWPATTSTSPPTTVAAR